MLLTALHFLVSTLLNLLTLLFLLRFFMQQCRASFNNPLGQLVMTLTDFAVKPTRKLIPSWKKLDLSTLLLAIVTQLVLQFCLLWLLDLIMGLPGRTPWLNIVGLGLIGMLRSTLDLFFYVILLQAILSWVNPNTPFAPVLESLSKPILAPIRRIVPIINGFDFSPLVALLLLQMLNISLIAGLEKRLSGPFQLISLYN